jgi:hypothetical protein
MQMMPQPHAGERKEEGQHQLDRHDLKTVNDRLAQNVGQYAVDTRNGWQWR